MNYLMRILCCVYAAMMIGCAATPTSESTGEYLDSAAITTKVKAKLLDELGAAGFSVKVKTYKDEVQLSGFVNNQSIKDKAASIASGVADVRVVRNSIVVKN